MPSAIVLDHSIFPELALRLARELGEIYYFSPWQSPFPDIVEQSIGAGFEDQGVTRVDFPLELIGTKNEPDVWVFPDLYFTDLQSHLRSLGKKVWGSGWGELLENDRWRMRYVLDEAGEPTSEATTVKGMDALDEHLQKNEESWIKLAQYFRGVTETHQHLDEPTSRMWALETRLKLGPLQDKLSFLIEKPIAGDAVEPGLDMMCVKGQPLIPTLLGFEIKGSGMVSVLIERLPKRLNAVLPMLEFLHREQYTNFASFEARMTKDKTFFIDPCCRMPSPGDGIHQEMWENLGQIILCGADGHGVTPEPTGKYAAQIVLHSPKLRDRAVHVEIPDEMRQWVKLRRVYQNKDGLWVLPNKLFDTVGGAVGIGDTLEEACDLAVERAKAVEGDHIEWDNDVLDRARKEMDKAETLGLLF